MNRSTLRNDVLDWMDATGSQRWDATAGQLVDRQISSVFDSIWRRILNASPTYLVGARTPTSTASGRYQFSDLNFGSGDALQRLYRVLGVLIDTYPYDGPVPFNEWSAQTVNNGGTNQRVWYQEGQALVALPIQALKAADVIWVNYIPQRPDSLEGEDSEVQFPSGHEQVLAALSAARLLGKAGAETQASAEITAMIRPAYDELIADVSRVATKPLAMQYADYASEWGA